MIDTSTDPYSVTDWANDLITAGHQFTVKPGQPANAAGPGEFFCIRLEDSNGGNDYRTNIGTCTPQATTCGASYGVEPGNMIGPTKQGVEDLLTIFGTVTPDTYVGIDTYGYPDGTSGPTSHQLIVAPIWDVGDATEFDCTIGSPSYNTLKGGATITIKVVGFATLFLERTQGNDVIARLVGLSGCDLSGGGIDPTEVGPFSLPLRLIRTD